MTAQTRACVASMVGLDGPPAADRIAELIDAADALTAALQGLRTHPTPERAERITYQLYGMQRWACQTVTTLAREAELWPATVTCSR